MMMSMTRASVLAAGLSLAAAPAVAAPISFFDDVAGGVASFNSTVTTAGGTVTVDVLSGLVVDDSWTRTGYVITSTDGSLRGIVSAGSDGHSGQAISIDPDSPVASSGITFTFSSPINALGFEVGDWATCCYPSGLYISFDGGATQQVGVANSSLDNPTTFGFGGAVFIGAIDDSSTFTTVTFYGDGLGEVLTAGGTVRYATVPIGSIPAPEPATLSLFGLALAGLFRYRRSQ